MASKYNTYNNTYNNTNSNNYAQYISVRTGCSAALGSNVYNHALNSTNTIPSTKPHIVVLGTGWGAVHFLSKLDANKYDVTVVSPRNYFAFTPLLPCVCSGSLTSLSCIEPIRSLKQESIDFFEAVCDHIDVEKKQLECFTKNKNRLRFNYDYMVFAVGMQPNTFGIQGVNEYAFFLKEVEHAKKIRKHIMNHFEQAALPVTSEEEKRRLLSLFVIGGGPTGVETAAELSDYILEDMSKYFPELISYVKVSLVELQPRLLPMFSEKVSDFTANNLKEKLKVDLLLECAVTKITKDSVIIRNVKNETVQELPQGFVLWASGISHTDLTYKFIKQISSEKTRNLEVDQQLRVKGVNSIYAIGDCATIVPTPLVEISQDLLQRASRSSFGVSSAWLKSASKDLRTYYPQISESKFQFPIEKKVFDNMSFVKYLDKIDRSYVPPTPTAQNARQEGEYLANIFNKHIHEDNVPGFTEVWAGSLAYVGNRQAVGTFPFGDMTGGFYSLPFWKAVYIQMQLTWRSRLICMLDWTRTRLTGRDVGRDHTFY